MVQNKRSAIYRYIYLNIYAYLLLFMGIGIVFVPLYAIFKPLLIAQAITAILFLKASIRVFRQWPQKRRSYFILMRQNQKEFRPDTFKKHMEAPCGRILVRRVLNDLNEKQRYKELKKRYSKPLSHSCRKTTISVKPQSTIIRINGEAMELNRKKMHNKHTNGGDQNL